MLAREAPVCLLLLAALITGPGCSASSASDERNELETAASAVEEQPALDPGDAELTRLFGICTEIMAGLKDQLPQGLSPREVSAVVGAEPMDWYIALGRASDRSPNPWRWQAYGMWSLLHRYGEQVVLVATFDDKVIAGAMTLDLDGVSVEPLLTALIFETSFSDGTRQEMGEEQYEARLAQVREVAGSN